MTALRENDKPVRLELLGEFSLRGANGRLIEIAGKKNRALLAILALSPGLHATREKLAGLLWGDRGEDQARSSLRQALAMLRKELGEAGRPVLEMHDDLVALRPDALSIDAVEFIEAANAGDVTRLRAAALLHRGELLADLALNEKGFEDWMAAERRRIGSAAIALLDRLVPLETGHAQIEASERLLALDPLRESSHRQLIRVYALQGERALALKQFDLCNKLLRDELGIEPSRETRELRRQIAHDENHLLHSYVTQGMPTQARSEDRPPSVAVLPFANLSDDQAQGYFSDGVTEDIITELSRWRLLAVQSRSASFLFRGVAGDVKQIARELNVRYIVEGSVRRIGDRIRIAVQLIDTETGAHIWAEKFDREIAEIFAVQDQVVGTIVSTLAGRVQAAAVERVRRKPPASLAAYECVLKGNALPWSDPAGAAEAARLFAKAVEMDPGYGFAHAMLANMYCRNWRTDPTSSDDTLQEAYDLAKRAVELDGNDSTCFAILGQVCLFRHSYDIALNYMRRAIEINPNNQWNTADLGFVLVYLGEAEAALDCFSRAREIDPYFGPSWFWTSLGQAYMLLRRYEEALAAFEHLPSRGYWIAALMAGCHARLSEMDRARVLANECLAKRSDFTIGRNMAREPYRNPADAAHLAESLKIAGLPDDESRLSLKSAERPADRRA